jgi:predicted lipoprotein with Yx(FWY)xxD motif
MKRVFLHATGMPVVLCIAMLFAACSKSDNSSINNNNNNHNPSVQVIDNPQFGKILADSNGRTLYFFAPDVSGNSACTGSCLVTWPSFYVKDPSVSQGIGNNDIEDFERTDGEEQLTYKGWPLYYYASDAKQGDVKGDGLNGLWFVAKPDYTLMIARAQLVGDDGKNYKHDYIEGTEATVYIVDSLGCTLYAFSPDQFNTNRYTLADFSNDAIWPIFQVSTVQNLPSLLSKADFGSINVFGKKQLTFKGWPLYYFGPDGANSRGVNKGVSVPTPGFWPVVNNSTATAPQ